MTVDIRSKAKKNSERLALSLQAATGRRGGLAAHRARKPLLRSVTYEPPRVVGSGLFVGPRGVAGGVYCERHRPDKNQEDRPGEVWRELSKDEVRRISEEEGEPLLCEDWDRH